MAHAVDDMLRITSQESIDLVGLNSGYMSEYRKTGHDVLNSLLQYMDSRTEPNLNKVIYPLSMHIDSGDVDHPPSGIGIVDVKKLIPSQFLQPNVILTAGSEVWKTAVVPSPGVAITHHDFTLCGQIMAHFFGTKVTFIQISGLYNSY